MEIQNGICPRFIRASVTGFTVIEFAVTLALIGIGLGLAVPSLQTLFANNEIIAASNAIVTGMNSGALQCHHFRFQRHHLPLDR